MEHIFESKEENDKRMARTEAMRSELKSICDKYGAVAGAIGINLPNNAGFLLRFGPVDHVIKICEAMTDTELFETKGEDH